MQGLVDRAWPGRMAQHQPAIVAAAKGNHPMRAQIHGVEQFLKIADIQRRHGNAGKSALWRTDRHRHIQL